jgi:hypothetical protein
VISMAISSSNRFKEIGKNNINITASFNIIVKI